MVKGQGKCYTIADRLKQAIEARPSVGPQRGVRRFQRDMKARGEELAKEGERLPGTTLTAIQTYLNAEVEPPLAWCREAAHILGVMPGWLAFGIGGRTSEEDWRTRTEIGERVDTLAREILPGDDFAGGANATLAFEVAFQLKHMLHPTPQAYRAAGPDNYEDVLPILRDVLMLPFQRLGVEPDPDRSGLKHYTRTMLSALALVPSAAKRRESTNASET